MRSDPTYGVAHSGLPGTGPIALEPLPTPPEDGAAPPEIAPPPTNLPPNAGGPLARPEAPPSPRAGGPPGAPATGSPEPKSPAHPLNPQARSRYAPAERHRSCMSRLSWRRRSKPDHPASRFFVRGCGFRCGGVADQCWTRRIHIGLEARIATK